jgi:uncharacterized repeat protein (TIGR02543 family)
VRFNRLVCYLPSRKVQGDNMTRKIFFIIIVFIFLLITGCDDSENATISPTTESFDKNIVHQADIVVTMTLNGNTLEAIGDGSRDLVAGSDYDVSGQAVTISRSYLANQTPGALALTFDFNAGNDPVLTVVVSDTTRAEADYTLIIEVSGNGATDPAAGTYDFAGGSRESVRAAPASGATFAGWSGAATGTANPVTVTMDADQTLIASFTDGDDDPHAGCQTQPEGDCDSPQVRIHEVDLGVTVVNNDSETDLKPLAMACT